MYKTESIRSALDRLRINSIARERKGKEPKVPCFKFVGAPHLRQTVHCRFIIFVICRYSVGVHCRAEEGERDRCLPQLDRLVLRHHREKLQDQICRDHCEEGACLADERIDLVVSVVVREES